MIGPFVILDAGFALIAANQAGLAGVRVWCQQDGIGGIGLHQALPATGDGVFAIHAGFALLESRGRQRIAHPGLPQLVLEMELLAPTSNGTRLALLRFLPGLAAIAVPDGTARLAALTAKEREVALLVRAGLTNKQIARRLLKSIPTVKMQVQSALKKLGAANRTDLASKLSGLPEVQGTAENTRRHPLSHRDALPTQNRATQDRATQDRATQNRTGSMFSGERGPSLASGQIYSGTWQYSCLQN